MRRVGHHVVSAQNAVVVLVNPVSVDGRANDAAQNPTRTVDRTQLAMKCEILHARKICKSKIDNDNYIKVRYVSTYSKIVCTLNHHRTYLKKREIN